MTTDSDIALARRESIADALRRSARRDPERVALRFAERTWTYAALDAAANRVARRLADAGLEPGQRVAAYGRNSDAYLVTWLACLRAGLVHVPVNYALTAGELGYIVRQSGASALVCDSALAPNVAASEDCARVAVHGRFTSDGAASTGPSDSVAGASASGSAFDVLATALDEGADAAPLAARYAHPVAQILYTSGTTAEPKGAVMTHAALLAHYASCIASAELAAADRSLDALPLYHSAQMHVILMPHLLLGATSVLIEAPEPATVLRLIEEHRITSFFAPPTVWISLLRHPDFDQRDLSTLRKVYYGASIMPVPVLEELRRRLPAAGAWNLYGQSEIGPLATVLRPEEHDERPASAGRPILNVETRVVDEAMQDAPPGVNGEIVHRSPQLLTEYWNKPEETTQAFAGGWFHTGDVGYRDEAGYLYVVDRLKDVINTGGIVVSSREIEETLFTHPAVYEAAVIALPDDRWVEAIAAVVVLRPGERADEAELFAHARATLAPFKVPKRIIFTDSLPRNTAGKLLKRELRAAYS
jgi:fatty-acyl-CoA synthase